MNSKELYHYTTLQNALMIIESGVINLATAQIEKNEKPVVWLSYGKNWESVSNKDISDENGNIRSLNRMETERMCGGLCRFAIDPSFQTFPCDEWITLSGVSSKLAGYLLNKVKYPTCDLWKVSFEPIPKEFWVNVQIWCGKEWETLTEENMKKRWSKIGFEGFIGRAS
jgi:hypothetical protein